MGYTVRNRLKFGKISWSHLLCTKVLKNGYREFDHSSTLSQSSRKWPPRELEKVVVTRAGRFQEYAVVSDLKVKQ